MSPLPQPDLSDAQCHAARLARDARFDGRFFTGVLTTGIYCRPVCPAKPPLERNVRYFFSAAAAEQAGLRPCLRCRPELAPAQWRALPGALGVALRAMSRGELAESSLEQLAAQSGVTARTLRRQCEQYLGVSPLHIEQTRRLLLAKQLLTDTPLAITEIAFAAGFGSLRRFNDAWLNAYGMAPSAIRRTLPAIAAADTLTLRLAYRPPYDWPAMLSFFRARAIKGIEEVSSHSYVRHIHSSEQVVTLTVQAGKGHNLELTLAGATPAQLPELMYRVRHMWDLDADPAPVLSHLAACPALAAHLHATPGLRLPGGWNRHEVMLRAIIGQQISVKGAVTILGRLVARRAEQFGAPALPTASELQCMNLDGLGLPSSRVRTLKALGAAISNGLDLDSASDAELLALPGIGPWTVAYWRLRCGDPDAFPASDLVLQKALEPGTRLSAQALTERAHAWRPWRAYAASWLWHSAAHPNSTGASHDPL